MVHPSLPVTAYIGEAFALALVWLALLANRSRFGSRWLVPPTIVLALLLTVLATMPVVVEGVLPPVSLEILAVAAGLLSGAGARWPRLSFAGSVLGVASALAAVARWVTAGGVETIPSTYIVVDVRPTLFVAVILGLQCIAIARLSRRRGPILGAAALQ